MLCDQEAGAVRGQPAQRVDDELLAVRVELRGRLVEHQVARLHGQQAGDRDELHLAAGQAPRIALGELVDAECLERGDVRLTTSSRSRPRFSAPKATSSKTVSATCDS